jgi:hypothetical protein
MHSLGSAACLDHIVAFADLESVPELALTCQLVSQLVRRSLAALGQLIPTKKAMRPKRLTSITPPGFRVHSRSPLVVKLEPGVCHTQKRAWNGKRRPQPRANKKNNRTIKGSVLQQQAKKKPTVKTEPVESSTLREAALQQTVNCETIVKTELAEPTLERHGRPTTSFAMVVSHASPQILERPDGVSEEASGAHAQSVERPEGTSEGAWAKYQDHVAKAEASSGPAISFKRWAALAHARTIQRPAGTSEETWAKYQDRVMKAEASGGPVTSFKKWAALAHARTHERPKGASDGTWAKYQDYLTRAEASGGPVTSFRRWAANKHARSLERPKGAFKDAWAKYQDYLTRAEASGGPVNSFKRWAAAGHARTRQRPAGISEETWAKYQDRMKKAQASGGPLTSFKKWAALAHARTLIRPKGASDNTWAKYQDYLTRAEASGGPVTSFRYWAALGHARTLSEVSGGPVTSSKKWAARAHARTLERPEGTSGDTCAKHQDYRMSAEAAPGSRSVQRFAKCRTLEAQNSAKQGHCYILGWTSFKREDGSYVRIDDFAAGDIVVDADGNKTEILSYVRHEGPHEVVSIFAGGNNHSFTASHRVMVQKESGIEATIAAELRKGSWVLVDGEPVQIIQKPTKRSLDVEVAELMFTRDAVVEAYSISQGLATKGYEGEPGASMIKCEDTLCSTTAQPRRDVPGNTTGITDTVAQLATQPPSQTPVQRRTKKTKHQRERKKKFFSALQQMSDSD